MSMPMPRHWRKGDWCTLMLGRETGKSKMKQARSVWARGSEALFECRAARGAQRRPAQSRVFYTRAKTISPSRKHKTGAYGHSTNVRRIRTTVHCHVYAMSRTMPHAEKACPPALGNATACSPLRPTKAWCACGTLKRSSLSTACLVIALRVDPRFVDPLPLLVSSDAAGYVYSGPCVDTQTRGPACAPLVHSVQAACDQQLVDPLIAAAAQAAAEAEAKTKAAASKEKDVATGGKESPKGWAKARKTAAYS